MKNSFKNLYSDGNRNPSLFTLHPSLTKQDIALFGYGLTTRAIAKRLGGGCTFFDDNCKAPYTDEAGNRIFPSELFDPDRSELEITTPSLPPKHPLILKAKHLLSEYDFFLSNHNNASLITCHSSLERHSPFTVWVSGTNGKTTTTQMLTHLLAPYGAVSGGNIGTPLADLDPDAPIWVLETSSFTMHHTRYASPGIYLLLPITPDHLDWHGSFDAYIEDKLRPLRTMREGALALVPKGLPLPPSDAWIVEYEDNASIADFFGIDMNKLAFKGAFLQDALLAMAVAKTLFDRLDYDRMNAFERDAHRQEEFTDSKGRVWVNDSKATNLDATIQAVKAYSERHMHLILGGDDKGVDLDPLFALLQHQEVTIYAIGSNEERLLTLAKKYGIDAQACGMLEKAVEAIDRVHDGKSVALLSPAAASLDQFKNYKERGERFKHLVAALD